jgi:hypothetical protein
MRRLGFPMRSGGCQGRLGCRGLTSFEERPFFFEKEKKAFASLVIY